MKKTKIGLVNGLGYYDYNVLITSFFDKLNVSYIIGDKTTKKTVENGKKLLIDESCLSLKIFFGHIYELINKCEYVLVVRSPSIRKNEMMCTNFYALYDLSNTLFPGKVIELNIDYNNDITLKKAFINLGKKLGFSKKYIKKAFKHAYNYYLTELDKLHENELKLLNSNNKKVLLVGHSYNLMDQYISNDIIKILKENNIEILNSNKFKATNTNRYKIISKDIYWSKSKDILNVIVELNNYIDGIILVSSFPCGIDSLVNELIIRKVNMPILNLVIDELNDNSGISTRVESFVDIIKMEEYKWWKLVFQNWVIILFLLLFY